MRLLNCTTLALEEFFDADLPRYAILSHRWLPTGECTLATFNPEASPNSPGYAKIYLSCTQAIQDGITHLWVDTICIDKSSSAELSESINSMYHYYASSLVCYVYLHDVEAEDLDWGTEDGVSTVSFRADFGARFGSSTWWHRGWTLQELIAPPNVVFYNVKWVKLGTKEDLRSKIADITGIDVDVLMGAVNIEDFSVAKRMSWASKRSTTRIEDLAYSLLGIFNVNMPMLYGEGPRAFLRLQEEIMKHSDDHSIFAWSNKTYGFHGMLAESPRDFASCSNIILTPAKLNRMPYSITNMGLSIELLTVPWAIDTYMASLDCCEIGMPGESRTGIFLRLLHEKNQYARVSLEGKTVDVFPDDMQGDYKKIYSRQSPRFHPTHLSSLHPIMSVPKLYGFWIREIPLTVASFSAHLGDHTHILSKTQSRNSWDANERLLKIPIGYHGTAGILWWASDAGYSMMRLGFDDAFQPVVETHGPLWGDDPDGMEPNVHGSIEEVLDNTWIKPLKPVIKYGSEVTGWEWRVPPSVNPHFVNVREIAVAGELRWVVDVALKLYTCDSCQETIPGHRYHCEVCLDFDLCPKCRQTFDPSEAHPGHEFKSATTLTLVNGVS